MLRSKIQLMSLFEVFLAYDSWKKKKPKPENEPIAIFPSPRVQRIEVKCFHQHSNMHPNTWKSGSGACVAKPDCPLLQEDLYPFNDPSIQGTLSSELELLHY